MVQAGWCYSEILDRDQSLCFWNTPENKDVFVCCPTHNTLMSIDKEYNYWVASTSMVLLLVSLNHCVVSY